MVRHFIFFMGCIYRWFMRVQKRGKELQFHYILWSMMLITSYNLCLCLLGFTNHPTPNCRVPHCRTWDDKKYSRVPKDTPKLVVMKWVYMLAFVLDLFGFLDNQLSISNLIGYSGLLHALGLHGIFACIWVTSGVNVGEATWYTRVRE